MTITQLHYVLAVAEYKNFTKAAERVFVTQPTLSMQVQKLEEELGIKIFDRTKKPIELTEVGARIVEQAKNIVNESNRIKDIVDQQKGFIGGEFRLGIIPTVMPTLLPMFLQTFIKKYPKVSIKIEELTTEMIFDKLREGHLDAAIAATPLNQVDIVEKPLFYEPFVGYINNQHKLSSKATIAISDLDPDDLLLLEDGHCFTDNVLNICSSSKLPYKDNFNLKSGSFETLIKLSDEGLGMTLLPYLHTLDLDEKRKKNLRMFNKPYPSREVSLIHYKSELKIQIVQKLHDVISGVIRGAIAFQDVKIISPLKK